MKTEHLPHHMRLPAPLQRCLTCRRLLVTHLDEAMKAPDGTIIFEQECLEGCAIYSVHLHPVLNRYWSTLIREVRGDGINENRG